MKVWKMTGCLLLLCVIICGCVMLGKSTTAAATEGEAPQEQAQEPPSGEEGTSGNEESEEGSTAVEKRYSKGLYFRSNGDGTCAVAGMGSCTASCVLIPPQSPAGDRVVEVLPYAFAGSIVSAIELPTTVTDVTAASFADCERLAYVRVAAGNSALLEYDGALYSADGSVLLYCPAGRSASELKLNPALKRIAAGALARCDGLDTVVFAGSTSAWHGIVVGDENDALYAARVCFVSE